jgi:hypothetical protein
MQHDIETAITREEEIRCADETNPSDETSMGKSNTA